MMPIRGLRTLWSWNDEILQFAQEREQLHAHLFRAVQVAERLTPLPERDYEAEAAEERKAYERAEQLLLSMLSAEQLKTYANYEYFDVTGSEGGQYRIWAVGHVGNVEPLAGVVSSGRRLCAHHRGEMPEPDAYLAQALYIITDEPGFLRVANRMGAWGGYTAGVRFANFH